MIDLALNIGFGMLSVAILLGLIRLVRGPSVMDRVMSFDLITTCAVGMIVLLSIRWHTVLYLELILIFSLLGFLTTVAFVFYLHRTIGPDGEPRTRGTSGTKSDQPESTT
jgi:multisubunit Na+/H+ antiporter MnhF subunit